MANHLSEFVSNYQEEIMKTLVIYFSRTGENYVNGNTVFIEKGNTQLVAEFIGEAAGADLFQIERVPDYPEDYMECTKVAREEMKTNARPELREYLKDVSEYENIVAAFPCWWGNCPNVMLSQLEKLDLRGKKIFPVITHEGSGAGKSEKTLKKACKGAKVMKALAIHGGEAVDSEEMIKAWARANLK